jgi:hypothetical protein
MELEANLVHAPLYESADCLEADGRASKGSPKTSFLRQSTNDLVKQRDININKLLVFLE